VSGDEARALEVLHAVGYAEGEVPADGTTGVTRLLPDKVQPGLNLYCSADAPRATLMDMQGEPVHEWSREFGSIWPAAVEHAGPEAGRFRRVYLLENGDLLAIFEGLGLVRLDADSQVVWAKLNGAHHDLDVRPDGDIWVLTRRWRRTSPQPTLFDYVTVLDADGNERRSVSLHECLMRSPYRSLFERSPDKTGDVFHTNTLFVLDDSIAERAPAFRAGRVLTSFRTLNALAVVDLEREEVVWVRTGDFRQQHDPQLLPNGNVLFFDNLGLRRFSRVIEFDPVTLETIWSYAGSPERPFFSKTCGTAQRLANGNTLITESSRGRAIEVLPDGTIAWEFRSPGRVGKDRELVARLYDVWRLPPGFPTGWLEGRR